MEHLTIPCDRGGFSRRECPVCHRQFKLRWTERDGGLLLKEISSVVSLANDDEVGASVLFSCPYCGHKDEAGAWWTSEQQVLLSKRAESLQAEIRFEQLRHVERSLGVNPYPTFVPVPPAPFLASLPPEPDDMRLMLLLCCEEEVKIGESWSDPIHCPFCGRETG